MANYRAEFLYELQDASDARSVLRLVAWLPDTTTAADLKAASDGVNTAIGNAGHVTNAKVVRRGVRVIYDRAQTDPSAPNPPLDSWYPNVVQKALLKYSNANGVQAQLALPAPIRAIFHAAPSSGVVNASNAAVASFNGVAESLLQDATLTSLNLAQGGTYRTGHTRRRRPTQ